MRVIWESILQIVNHKKTCKSAQKGVKNDKFWQKKIIFISYNYFPLKYEARFLEGRSRIPSNNSERINHKQPFTKDSMNSKIKQNNLPIFENFIEDILLPENVLLLAAKKGCNFSQKKLQSCDQKKFYFLNDFTWYLSWLRWILSWCSNF